jgi:hypothetical protein
MWREVIMSDDNAVWRRLAQDRWRLVSERSSTKDWFGYYKRRCVCGFLIRANPFINDG